MALRTGARWVASRRWVAQQVLERFGFGVGVVERRSCVGHQLGCCGHRVDIDQLVPLVALGEIESGQRVEEPGLGFGLLDRLGAQSLLQQAVAAR